MKPTRTPAECSLSPLRRPATLGVLVGLIVAAELLAQVPGCGLIPPAGSARWEVKATKAKAKEAPPSSGSATPRRE